MRKLPRVFHRGTAINFGDKREVTTSEVLEEFGISYDTLASRIRQSDFPRPVAKGQNGRVALYNVAMIYDWCIERGIHCKLSKNV